MDHTEINKELGTAILQLIRSNSASKNLMNQRKFIRSLSSQKNPVQSVGINFSHLLSKSEARQKEISEKKKAENLVKKRCRKLDQQQSCEQSPDRHVDDSHPSEAHNSGQLSSKIQSDPSEQSWEKKDQIEELKKDITKLANQKRQKSKFDFLMISHRNIFVQVWKILTIILSLISSY